MKAISMKNLFPLLTFFLLLSQLPISMLFDRENVGKSPKFTLENLVNGSYGKEIESFLAQNNYFFFLSGSEYRRLIFEHLGKYSSDVVSRGDEFLFLRDSIRDINSSTLEKVSWASDKVVSFHKQLEANGVPLLVVLIPERTHVYKEIAYRNKEIPHNRKLFFDKFYNNLKKSGVNYISLYDSFRVAESDDNIKTFFSGDHHWTYDGAKLAVPIIANKIDALLGDEPTKKLQNPIYSVNWKQQVTPRRNLIEKLGMLAHLPNRFQKTYSVPRFELIEKKTLLPLSDRVMHISASFGEFGSVEQLSNYWGYQVPSSVLGGQGPVYVATNFLQKYIINKHGGSKPKALIWLLPEYNISSDMVRSSSLPINFDLQNYKKANFKVKNVSGAREKNNSLKVKSGVVDFEVHTQSLSRKFVLSIKSKGRAKRSFIKLFSSNKELSSQLLIHDNELSYYHFEIKDSVESEVVRFQIETLNWKSSSKRRVQFVDLYVEN